MDGVEASAIGILRRAVDLDSDGNRLDEATTLYQEGTDLLLQLYKVSSDFEKKSYLRGKISQYLERAEALKKIVNEQKEADRYHEKIHIGSNSVGHSFNSLFGRFITEDLTSVEIEDPYIRNTHQIYNFLRLCELFVHKKSSLRSIVLITGFDEDSSGQAGQRQKLDSIQASLRNHGVQLTVRFSATLHDREIRFDNGWVIKIDRGLDIYMPAESWFSIGFCDFDLRPCRETVVHIFRRPIVNNV